MQTGMNIGTVVDKDSLDAVTSAIVKIMDQRADQDTIRHALDTLGKMARVEGVTIQNCVVNGDRRVNVDISADNADAEVRFNPND